MRFIHAADVHLDTPFQGLQDAPTQIWQQIQQSTFNAFTNLVDQAISLDVDFVLLVGDLYDQEDQSLQAQTFLVDEFKRLQAVNIPVYLSFGNHDFLSKQTVHFPFPDNVHIFGDQVETMSLETREHLRIAINGFSYHDRWLKTDQVPNYPIRQADADFEIGMLHGGMKGEPQQSNYAPFTIPELNALNYDYWALGHIHKRETLQENPPILYSGNLQGRHKNEPGAKGFYLVSAVGDKLVPEFKQTSVIDWYRLPIDVANEANLADVKSQINQAMQQQAPSQNTLVSVELRHAENLSKKSLQAINDDSFIEALQKDTNEKPFHFVYQIKLTFIKQQIFNMIDQNFWDQAAETVFSEDNLAETMRPLLKLEFLRTYLEDDQIQSDLKERVNNLLNEQKLGD